MKELSWRLTEGEMQRKLYYRHSYEEGWRIYTAHPLAQPDDRIKLSHGTPSKGYRTMQRLLKDGYKFAQD